MAPPARIPVPLLVAATEAEGPGVRVALWVQGCPMRCAGCCNPRFLPFLPEGSTPTFTADELLARCLEAPGEGATFLGGEPFAHAPGLALVAEGLQAAGRSVMVFSGFTLDELRAMGRDDEAVRRLLAATDLLVDGRYEAARRSTNRRWIGSDNQRLHHLSARYRADDPRLEGPNHVEIRLRAGEITVNGWPLAHGLPAKGPGPA